MKIKNILFPQSIYCIVCGKYIDDTRSYSLCDHCIQHMNFGCTQFYCNDGLCNKEGGSLSFDFGFSAMGYGLYERRLIFNLKYDGKTYLAPIIADIMYDAMQSKDLKLDADLIIPVPIHKKRLSERGFNQAEKIANHLSKKLSIPVAANVLYRAKETRTQRALSPEERNENMKGVFEIRKGKEDFIKDKRIILLDDIYTTGATVSSCGRELRKHGAKKIYVLTLLFAGNRHHLMVE